MRNNNYFQITPQRSQVKAEKLVSYFNFILDHSIGIQNNCLGELGIYLKSLDYLLNKIKTEKMKQEL